MPKSASGGKLFIHPAALLIVLVAAWFFKLSKTTAASELHETHPARSGVGSLGHSDSESHAVLLDERASATLLAAVAMGAAWAQSHDFSLWSMGAALPTIPHVSSQDIGETNILSNVASSLFAEGEGFFHAQNGSGAYDFRPANTSEGPSAISAGYRLLSVSNDHFAAYQTFHNFDMPTLAEDQTARATCEQPSSATPLSAPAPIGGSTVSSESTDAAINPETPNAAVNSDTTDPDTTPTVQGSTLSTPVSGTENALTADATPTGSIPIVGATTTYALTTGNNTNKSLGHDSAFAVGDVIIGVIDTASGRANTLNPGDALLLSGATLRIIDIQHSKTTNELSDLSLAGPFQFIVHELAAEGGVFDFTLASGATRVESLNSTGNVTFTNLAKGTISEISGSTTHAGSIVSVTYALPTTAESFEINGGVSGVSFETPATSTDAPTTETILSTGAANGTAAKPDLFHITNSAGSVTSLTMVASASLVAGLWDLDFNDAAGATTLTVSGPAALVDLTQDFTDAPFSTVSASGLTAGGLHLCASNDLTSFTGGGGGNNELLYTGEDLSASATKIDGGGTGNILSSQLVNLTNGGIFANWQILDITDYGGTPFDTSWLSNDPITGAQFHAGDRSAETVLNIAPAATAAITGTGFTVSGLSITHSSAVGDSLAITIDNTDSSAALSTLWLSKLTSTGDTTVAVDSTGAAGNMAAGWNGIGTLDETDGHLTTMTVTGNTYTYVGSSGGISTDSGATSTADITSALTKIDASATTGGASIYAGNTTLDGSGFEVNYTGLTIDGGSGTKDVLYNGANDGVTVDLNGNGDAIWLGGSKASGVLGTGASDMAVIGSSPYSTALIANGPEWAGAALGDTVKFGAGATAEVIISGGAEWDGAHYVGNNIGNGVGQTTVVGAVVAGAGDAGTLIDVDYVVGAVTNIQNEQAAITGAMNLTAAENAAVAALGAVGVAYFTYGSDKFLVAAHTAEAAVSAGDAVVELHGVSITGLYMVGGVVHLV